jgi:DNA polymerase III subunit delta
VRAAARAQGYTERQVLEVDKHFDWNRLTQAGASLSLFAERRLIELRLKGGPGAEGGAVLAAYCARPPDDTVLLISTGKLDGRSRQAKWHQAIDRIGATITVWPIEPARLPDWISGRFRRYGLTVDRDAADLIAQRVEGNLLAAAQEVEKLCLLHAGQKRIDLAAALAAVADSARYDAFTLIEGAYAGDLVRTLRILQGLRDEGAEAIAIHGALLWQLRRTCSLARARAAGEAEDTLLQRYRIFDNQRDAFRRLLKRHPPRTLERLLHDAGRIDGLLKGYRDGEVWQALAWLLARLAGHDLPPPAEEFA